jgi:hypothetical protein
VDHQNKLGHQIKTANFSTSLGWLASAGPNVVGYLTVLYFVKASNNNSRQNQYFYF